MTGQKTVISHLQLCVLCAPAFAPAAIYGLLLRNKRCWMGSPFSFKQYRRTVEQIYGCLGSHYFWWAYHLSYESFLFFHEKLSVKIAKDVDDVRPYEQRGGGDAIISHPQCVMGLLALLLDWRAHCIISLVVRHMTSWRSMDFPMRQCMKVYGWSLRLWIVLMSFELNIQHLRQSNWR